MAVQAGATTYTRIDALVKVDVQGQVDNQGRRELSFTEADASALMYALADTLGYDVSKRDVAS